MPRLTTKEKAEKTIRDILDEVDLERVVACAIERPITDQTWEYNRVLLDMLN